MNSMKELFFHEDFYCQVELLPVSAVQHCDDEMKKVDEFSAAHWDGTAWTKIYLRDNHSAHLRSLGIRIQDIADKLDLILERVEAIFTGYSTYSEQCKETRGWVFPNGCGLLADYRSDGVVQHIWLVKEPPDITSLESFKNAVEILGGCGGFVIADWNKDILVPCFNDGKLRRYFLGLWDDDE